MIKCNWSPEFFRYGFPKIDYLYFIGGIFAGFNWSVYQENGFSPNINYTAGYLLPQDKYKIRMRIGVQYYNGRSLMNQFYYKKERFVGFYLAFDV
jgi:hypothetical protein